MITQTNYQILGENSLFFDFFQFIPIKFDNFHQKPFPLGIRNQNPGLFCVNKRIKVEKKSNNVLEKIWERGEDRGSPLERTAPAFRFI